MASTMKIIRILVYEGSAENLQAHMKKRGVKGSNLCRLSHTPLAVDIKEYFVQGGDLGVLLSNSEFPLDDKE